MNNNKMKTKQNQMRENIDSDAFSKDAKKN